MDGEVSWDSRFVIGLLMARVERLLPRCVIRRIDDFNIFWHLNFLKIGRFFWRLEYEFPLLKGNNSLSKRSNS
jgi:hypothetical protein